MSVDASLPDRVREQLRGLRGLLGPLLGEELGGFLSSLSVDVEADPLGNFTRVAQPVVHLPLWIAEAAASSHGREVEGAALWAAVEAAVTGYLCAQVQDRIVDGAGGVPERAMLLAHALFTRHQVVLAPLVARRPEFWGLYQQTWMAYAEALALERQANRADAPVDQETFARILRRSHPLLIPGAALLAHLDLWELRSALEQLVQHSTMAAQLFDDAVDATGDLEEGNRTWVVRRFGGDEGGALLARRLYLEGGFDCLVREAQGELALARDAALALGMERGATALAADHRRMADAREVVVSALALQFSLQSRLLLG